MSNEKVDRACAIYTKTLADLGKSNKDHEAHKAAMAAVLDDLNKFPVSEHVRKLIGRIDMYRLRMSYNDSYFGEPAGLLKGVFAELAHAVNPIYPSGKTALSSEPELKDKP